MFFRREHPKVDTFEERLQMLQQTGFVVEPKGSEYLVSRDGCAAVIEKDSGGRARIVERPGLRMGEEIAVLVDGGFQKFFRTPVGRRQPALAVELKSLHRFEEDLRQLLGLASLYNEALGTVSNAYLYDRVEGRDTGVPKRPWEP